MKKTLFRLKPCKTIQKNFYVFDVETVDGIRTKLNSKQVEVKYVLRARPENFLFGVLYGPDGYQIFTDIKDVIKEFNKSKYKGIKIFAHNGEYDFTCIFGNIYDMDPGAIFNGKFISASNGNCIFADSMNIYRTSVRKLGKLIGYEKMFSKDDYNKFIISENKIPEKEINNCVRDCEIIYKALIRAFEFSGQICITQASLSLAYFRRYHLPYNINHESDKTKYFYNSYYGGRTEVFKLGNTNAVVYDVNSMYPWAMKNTVFPNPSTLKHLIPISGRQLSVSKFLQRLENFEGAAFLKIKHKPFWLGFLPHKQNGKLIFPVGIFSGWWNFNEIRYALEKGMIEILEVKEYIFGVRMKGIFDSYVSHLYTERFKTADAFEIFRIKIYMNELYGKLAQRIDKETIYLPNVDAPESLSLIKKHKDNKTFIKISAFSFERCDGFLEVKTARQMLSYSIPSFASYITSAARVRLLDKLIQSKNNRPVYCDTDSVFMEIPLPEEKREIISNMPILGGWKLENKIVTKIHGLKNYEYIEAGEQKRALKGVPKSAKETRPNFYEYETLLKTKEALRRNLPAGILTKRTKEIKFTYDKRIILENGETEPIQL